MFHGICLTLMVLLSFTSDKSMVLCGGALGDAISTAAANRYNSHVSPQSEQHHKHAPLNAEHSAKLSQQSYSQQRGESAGMGTAHAVGSHHSAPYNPTSGTGHVDHRSSYNLLSEAMSQAVSNEFHSVGSGSADGACQADDLECYSGNVQDRLGMEAIRTLHRQLDDDDNGNIDLSESDDFLREELKYDSGYEKRQKAFHFNDDMHISVKELWEAWLRSEVHNWTIEQTTDWLAQSVQLPQYVELFKQHKVIGASLPRLAVNNMHYVSNVLGIKDPIHKQKIALKAMDVVLFGPPRETGTRWKDYILVTLLLSAIIGCWYAYQQNKNAKRHLRRMAKDMEGLQRAEQSLQEMQKELERARMEQENVATEKLDLERRLKEAPSVSTSNSDLEVQKLKKEIEILRTELSRAEIELVDNCWSPPPQLQSWLQYTYELESKNHLKKRVGAEKQLQCAREACEKLRKKRSSLVGAFVSTHGKSIDDVDRSIVEARNSLGEVTHELQERLHRWKQIESCLGLSIVNNNGLAYLESVLYGRGNSLGKSSRARVTGSTDDLDDESVQGYHDSYSRMNASTGGMIGNANTMRDDSSGSDDGADSQSVHFYLGSTSSTSLLNPASSASAASATHRSLHSLEASNSAGNNALTAAAAATAATNQTTASLATAQSGHSQQSAPTSTPALMHCANPNLATNERSQSADLVTMEASYSYLSKQYNLSAARSAVPAGAPNHNSNTTTATRARLGKMVKQHSNASQQSTSSTSSSVQSAPAYAAEKSINRDQSPPQLSVSTQQDQQQQQQQQQQQHNYMDRPSVIHFINKPISGSLSLQSLPSGARPHHECPNTAAASLAASTHSETHMEQLRQHPLHPQSTADSVNAEADLKKRRRRLRFPFGSKKSVANDSISKSKTSAS